MAYGPPADLRYRKPTPLEEILREDMARMHEVLPISKLAPTGAQQKAVENAYNLEILMPLEMKRSMGKNWDPFKFAFGFVLQEHKVEIKELMDFLLGQQSNIEESVKRIKEIFPNRYTEDAYVAVVSNFIGLYLYKDTSKTAVRRIVPYVTLGVAHNESRFKLREVGPTPEPAKERGLYQINPAATALGSLMHPDKKTRAAQWEVFKVKVEKGGGKPFVGLVIELEATIIPKKKSDGKIVQLVKFRNRSDVKDLLYNPLFNAVWFWRTFTNKMARLGTVDEDWDRILKINERDWKRIEKLDKITKKDLKNDKELLRRFRNEIRRLRSRLPKSWEALAAYNGGGPGAQVYAVHVLNKFRKFYQTIPDEVDRQVAMGVTPTIRKTLPTSEIADRIAAEREAKAEAERKRRNEKLE